jgi:hypothetical protein
MLSVTGVVIWTRKRRARLSRVVESAAEFEAIALSRR